MREKVFAEIGFGNESFISTEIENKKREYRVKKFVTPEKITELYIRIWLFKRVLVLSTKGFSIKKKNKFKFKFLFGIGDFN